MGELSIIAMVFTMATGVALFWQIITNVCALSTLALKVLPRPDQLTTIFMIKVPPHRYIVAYNLLRYSSNLGTGAGWQPDHKTNNKPTEERK